VAWRSGRLAETSSKSGSESNRARKRTKRSGSLSTTAIRIWGFLVGAAFMAVAAFIDMPVLGRSDVGRISALQGDARIRNALRITGVTWFASKFGQLGNSTHDLQRQDSKKVRFRGNLSRDSGANAVSAGRLPTEV